MTSPDTDRGTRRTGNATATEATTRTELFPLGAALVGVLGVFAALRGSSRD